MGNGLQSGCFRACAAAVVAVAGCTEPWFAAWGLAGPAPSPPPADARSTDAPPFLAVYDVDPLSASRESAVIQIAFDIVRVELPFHDVRHSAKVWNHVDEPISDPALAARLARNGMRVGVADEAAWPAMRAVFEANHARMDRISAPAPGGAAIGLAVGTLQPGETVFAYGAGGRLSGAGFPGGSKLVRIDYAVSRDDPDAVVLRVMPEIQVEADGPTSPSPVDLLRAPGAGDDRTLYHDLAAELVVRPGQLVVIGPSEAAAIPSLIGSRLFTRHVKGAAYETVLCITPKLTWVGYEGP